MSPAPGEPPRSLATTARDSSLVDRVLFTAGDVAFRGSAAVVASAAGAYLLVHLAMLLVEFGALLRASFGGGLLGFVGIPGFLLGRVPLFLVDVAPALLVAWLTTRVAQGRPPWQVGLQLDDAEARARTLRGRRGLEVEVAVTRRSVPDGAGVDMEVRLLDDAGRYLRALDPGFAGQRGEFCLRVPARRSQSPNQVFLSLGAFLPFRFLDLAAIPGDRLVCRAEVLLSVGGVASAEELVPVDVPLEAADRHAARLEAADGIELAAAAILEAGSTCPVCGDGLDAAVVRCDACSTPHHQECWDFAGQCAVYACTGTGPAAAPEPAELPLGAGALWADLRPATPRRSPGLEGRGPEWTLVPARPRPWADTRIAQALVLGGHGLAPILLAGALSTLIGGELVALCLIAALLLAGPDFLFGPANTALAEWHRRFPSGPLRGYRAGVAPRRAALREAWEVPDQVLVMDAALLEEDLGGEDVLMIARVRDRDGAYVRSATRRRAGRFGEWQLVADLSVPPGTAPRRLEVVAVLPTDGLPPRVGREGLVLEFVLLRQGQVVAELDAPLDQGSGEPLGGTPAELSKEKGGARMVATARSRPLLGTGVDPRLCPACENPLGRYTPLCDDCGLQVDEGCWQYRGACLRCGSEDSTLADPAMAGRLR